MQTPFYVSGFLYNPKTNQILLVQSRSETDQSLWSTMEEEDVEGEEAVVIFKRIINKLLNLDLKPKDIYPVYDYLHNTRNKFNYVFYAEVKNIKRFNHLKNGNLTWFTFNEALKLPLTSQIKRDIVVGERVINAKKRDIEAKKLFNSLTS
ncbi:hypothetical protein HYW41_05220 [Candidatus Daviesbacteria bacterium]|nr:hypothetical protein [Candidatus Daviesbacteria bacterium]